MSKSKKENQDWDDKVYLENNKKRKSTSEILNSYKTGEYEEEDFYYEKQEKFRNSSKKRRDY